MAEAVRLLVAGLPAEIVREIGLRLRGVTITEFENTQQMGRAASQGDSALVILSDALPVQDSVYIASRAKDASESVRIAYCISMAQAEATVHTLTEIKVDRFFLTPVDIEEMLQELGKMGRESDPRHRRSPRRYSRRETLSGREPPLGTFSRAPAASPRCRRA